MLFYIYTGFLLVLPKYVDQVAGKHIKYALLRFEKVWNRKHICNSISYALRYFMLWTFCGAAADFLLPTRVISKRAGGPEQNKKRKKRCNDECTTESSTFSAGVEDHWLRRKRKNKYNICMLNCLSVGWEVLRFGSLVPNVRWHGQLQQLTQL